MQLSKKPKIFCFIFLEFLEPTLNLQLFLKKNEPHKSNISGVIASEICAYLNA